MSTLEQEIIDKFHQLDKTAQRRVRALIEQETGGDAEDHKSWADFINATYGSLADDPMDEIDRRVIESGLGDNSTALASADDEDD